MSSASFHSEVISRKPSGSCLIHPSISSSSSDYDEGEEFDLLSETLKEPNPEDLLVRLRRPLCPTTLDSNLFPSAKGVLHLRRRTGIPCISCTSISLRFFRPLPDTQLSSILLPANRPRALSRFKSKKKFHHYLSSNVSSHSFPPNQTHHHECLPQVSESLCAQLRQHTASFRFLRV